MFKIQLIFALMCLAATFAAAGPIDQEIIPVALPDDLFEAIEGNSYFIPHFKMNWFSAFALCRTLGADLATIASGDELEALSEFLVKDGRSLDRFWIDLNDLSVPFQFYSFTTGRLTSYTKWSPRQPDNFRNNERCVNLWLTRDDAGEFAMNDAVCLNQEHFICKKRQ